MKKLDWLDLILLGAFLLVRTQSTFGDELSEIISHNLTGPNVCKKIISTNVSEVVVEMEPYLLITNVWCAQIPPRCKKTEIRMRKVEKLTHRTVPGIVRECCEGFVENESKVGCIPSCRLDCQNGKCIEPWNCMCNEGFFGSNCEYANSSFVRDNFKTNVQFDHSETAKQGEFPFLAAVFNLRWQKFVCPGTLITKSRVLSGWMLA